MRLSGNIYGLEMESECFLWRALDVPVGVAQRGILHEQRFLSWQDL
jgi:hypothetical protein